MAVFIGREIAISSTSRLNTGPEVAGCRWCDDGGDDSHADQDDDDAGDYIYRNDLQASCRHI